MSDNVKIHESWKAVLSQEFEQPYFAHIKDSLLDDRSNGIKIYPPGSLIFNAFNSTPFDKVKVVILGQDPYHGPGQAMGLSFSVPKNIPKPASLRNVYKELNSDLGIPIATHGDLTKWARQGVFLLNSILTVRHKSPGSHKGIGWHQFTDAVIKKLSLEKEGLIFLLWGNYAKSKKSLINELKHHVLESVHPSPLAGNAFLGNKHFSKTNEILKKAGEDPIDWNLTN
ncbi:MAG: uracil-DNA glycosylase [Bacteroidia bacterium]|nr:uracil-DNA glycosylase [Bacteroidia bacterium]